MLVYSERQPEPDQKGKRKEEAKEKPGSDTEAGFYLLGNGTLIGHSEQFSAKTIG